MARRMRRVCLAGGVVAVSLTAWAVLLDAAPPPWKYVITSVSVTDLGTLGGAESLVSDINDGGDVVGVSQTASGATHAFVARSGNLIDLGPGAASGINNLYDVVGTVGDSAVVWHTYLAGAIVRDTLPSGLPPAECREVAGATAINDNGVIVGWARWVNQTSLQICSDSDTAVQWPSASAAPHATVNVHGWGSWVYDINNLAQSVGHSHFFPDEPYRWQNGTTDEVPLPPSSSWLNGQWPDHGRAYGINNNGVVVGGWTFGSGTTRASLWDGYSAQSVLLGTLPSGTDSVATRINDQRFVTGVANRVLTSRFLSWVFTRAFLWHADFGMQELPVLPGASWCEGVSLNNRRSSGALQVAGTCLVAGKHRAVVWDVVIGRLSTLPPSRGV
jgi:probable HAF family extracellular repeat protein